MAASIPQMAINSFILWLYLQIAFLGYLRPRSKDAEIARIGAEGEAIANQVRYLLFSYIGSPLNFLFISVSINFDKYFGKKHVYFRKTLNYILFKVLSIASYNFFSFSLAISEFRDKKKKFRFLK